VCTDRRSNLSLKKKHIPLLISILIGIFSIIYYFLYYKYFKIDVDEGLLINGAMRILSGELPLKDFHQYTLGRYYLLAAWFLFFGKTIAVERLLFVILHTIKNILAFHVSRKIMPLPFCLIPPVLLLLMPGFWVKAFVNLILLVNICLVLKYLANPKKLNVFLIGLSVGFSVFFREDLAGYSFITVCILLLLLGISEKSKFFAMLNKWVSFGLWVLFAVLPIILLYWLRDGLAELVQGIYQTVRLGHIESYAFRSPLVFLKWPIVIKDRELGLSFPYLCMALFFVIGLILLSRFFIKRAETKIQNFSLLSIWILALFSFTHIWHWTHESRIPQSGALIYILLAYLIYFVYSRLTQTWKRKKVFSAVKSAALSVVFVVCLSILFFYIYFNFFGHPMVKYDSGGIALRSGVHQKILGTDRAQIYPPARQAMVYSKILSYIEKNTSSEDRILCFGESPLYFLANRKNATEFDNGRIPGYFPEKRKKFLSQIKNNVPKIIVVRQWEFRFWYPKMPDVLDFITSNYFYDTKIYNFYIFSSIDNSNKYITKGNSFFWKNQIEKSAAAYLKALEIQNKNRDVHRVLSRFFSNNEIAKRALIVLDGYYVQKAKGVWRLRWGSKEKQSFSGKIIFADTEKMERVILDVRPYYQSEKSIVLTQTENTIEYISKISNNIGGFDMIFSETPPPFSVQFDLKKDGKKIERVFVSGRGFVYVGDSFELRKAAK
jgi:hypothetical protein